MVFTLTVDFKLCKVWFCWFTQVSQTLPLYMKYFIMPSAGIPDKSKWHLGLVSFDLQCGSNVFPEERKEKLTLDEVTADLLLFLLLEVDSCG